jgi:hypothetical protein
MELPDLHTVTVHTARGLREAHHAGWQRVRDSRFASLMVSDPHLVERCGEDEARNAVGLVVAAEMLRASAELVMEIASVRGVDVDACRRGVAALLEDVGVP